MSQQPSPNHQRAMVLLGLALAAVLVVGASGLALRSVLRAPTAGSGRGSAGVGADAGSLAGIQVALDAARAYLDQDKAGAAVAILRAANEKFPGTQSIELLFGEALLQSGQTAEAYEHYDRAILIGPDHPEYRHAAGTIASTLGRFDDAEMHYLAAQRQDPKNPKYPLYLAQVQRKLSMNDAARANLLVAAKLDPSLALAWASLAAMALDENRPNVALQYVAKARTLEPERIDWRVIEAKIRMRQNEPEQAAALLLAIPVARRAADESVLAELSASLAMLGRTSEAADLYVNAVSANPDSPELAYQAAIWLSRDGRRDRAATFAAHAAAHGHGQAKALLAKLEE